MHGCASPSGQGDESVVDSYSQHEEGGGQVDADEGHPHVHAETEGSDGAHDGRGHPHQTQQGLRLDPVGHHASYHAEDDHHTHVEAAKKGQVLSLSFMVYVFGFARRVKISKQ